MSNTTAEARTAKQFFDAQWIKSKTGLSLPRVYKLWSEAAKEIDIPPYGCLRPHEAEEFLRWIKQNSPKARPKVENLLKSGIFVLHQL